MLYIIGLGLADERDISARGLDIVRRAERVYLEAYTAVLLVDKEQLVRSRSNALHAHPRTLIIACAAVGSLLWPLRHRRRP
jgi:diphthamide biosynthesis methyltransferase